MRYFIELPGSDSLGHFKLFYGSWESIDEANEANRNRFRGRGGIVRAMLPA